LIRINVVGMVTGDQIAPQDEAESLGNSNHTQGFRACRKPQMSDGAIQ
jgi:hypothetical protein